MANPNMANQVFAFHQFADARFWTSSRLTGVLSSFHGGISL